MRTWLRGKFWLLFMTFAVLLAIPAIAFADIVADSINDVDASVGSKTIVAGDSTSVGYRIQNQNTGGGPNGGDTQTSCNPADGSKANLSFNVLNVTASPNPLEISQCSGAGVYPNSASFTSENAGSYTITPTVTDSGGGVYQTGPSTWTLTVNRAKTQLTSVNGVGISGQSNGVLTATLSSFKTDGTTFNKNLSGKPVTFQIDGNAVSGTATTDNNGVAQLTGVNLTGYAANQPHTLTASFAQDDGYLASTGTGPMGVLPPPDSTPPSITPDVQGTLGDNGWYRSNVTVSWNVTDDQSPVSSKTGCDPTTISTDTAGQTLTCSATSGGGTDSKSVTIKRDATAPTIIQWSGGPDANSSHPFGNVPPAPTCDATSYELSGKASCVVTGYSNAVGEQTMTATATDNAGNKTTAPRTYTVTKADPVVSWDAPADITYGTLLGPDQLNATADVDGTFDYDPAAGTKLDAGTHQLSVTFNPTSNNYNSATKTVSINVEKADPVVSWDAPADITYGTALGATQLNASADAAGTFDYDPAAGTVLNAGTHTLSVQFTPTNTNNYNPASKTVQITVKKADPTITWNNPADITYGAALGNAQLNAQSDVAGSFAYTPDAGTVLNAGTHTLSVQFTPTNTNNYNSASKTVQITVEKATPVITWNPPANINYGTALGNNQLNATADVAGSFAYTPAAGTVLNAGTHTLTANFTPTDTGNYKSASKTVQITVNPYNFGSGFFQPVDNRILNGVKGGSTVPMKFEVFQGPGGNELKSTSAIKSTSTTKATCDSAPAAGEDAIEEYTTGNTSLRFDTTGDQFILNWQAPKATAQAPVGTCYRVTIVANDGSATPTTLWAMFKIK